MRLLLKKDSEYHRVFKITVRGKNQAGNMQLIGQISLFDYIKEYLPNASKVDIHFSYFSDGNYHFSYKYYDQERKLYVDRKVYHQNVALREGVSLKPEDMLKVGDPKVRDMNDPLDMFMMGEPMPAWNVRPLGITFTTMGTTLNAKNLEGLVWGSEKKVNQENDLILEVSDFMNEQVSFGCSFYSEGNPTHDFDVTPIPKETISKYYMFDGLVVHLYMVLVNKQRLEKNISESNESTAS